MLFLFHIYIYRCNYRKYPYSKWNDPIWLCKSFPLFLKQKGPWFKHFQPPNPSSELPTTFHISWDFFGRWAAGTKPSAPRSLKNSWRLIAEGLETQWNQWLFYCFPVKRWEKVVYKSYNLEKMAGEMPLIYTTYRSCAFVCIGGYKLYATDTNLHGN